MSDPHGNGKEAAEAHREKPLFFSTNRKLRHLQGVSIRNLLITPPTRLRGKTIDDDDIPQSLITPTKLIAQEENQSLAHSRSYTDLKSSLSSDAPAVSGKGNKRNDERIKESRRRRRSTLAWSGGDMESRQSKLEDISRSRLATTWFSIHCDGIDDPVYISEVVENAMNPAFRFFDLNECGPYVSRQDELTLKLWAKSDSMSEFMLLLELQLSLRSLQFLGKSLETFHHPLPTNCVLFHFPDGIFTNLTGLPPSQSIIPTAAPKNALRNEPQPTSSYDALMRLANLDECIQDALATRGKLEAQINAILVKNHSTLDLIDRVSQAEEKVSLVKQGTTMERKQVRWNAKRRDDLASSIRARREAMALGREIQAKAHSHLPDARLKMSSSSSLLDKNDEDVKGQIRRICEDLSVIYPIEPIAGKALAFTVAGLALPNSSFGDIDRESVSAALGYTAHLVYLLSFYLSVPLPYPVKPYLSNSIIQDPVSIALPRRTFPLYPVNVQYRFEYGVFLLNKDIEFLMSRAGLRVLDIRHTLPNLKYLLYTLTARTSELPARKAGGFRGLLLGRRTPTLSRQGSQDSFASGEMALSHQLSSDVQVRTPQGSDDGTKAKASFPKVQSFTKMAAPVVNGLG
ncbi:UV radiation resistance protein and autophagy-related subunit 14-domain-containing protein [Talaromyces proteolyticus]|uniref:Autophagy-related protein 14 n=1 Tax=Talaromyces proteolyticus TaxID=1131652 RepID=A0AAD4L663_9EURO|nr:UV radiation resistance protein and autophagy-related subunit 14-domain-containing protein [Talaromyces proteolyticus]KAH8705320.1 UV radiation resistance protein and autophagy-related subunit 14-domain-containing protein [Talaromyces proteolyticus]